MTTSKNFNELKFKVIPLKHPFGPLALANSTGLMLFKEQGLKLRLFFLSPDVARANMM